MNVIICIIYASSVNFVNYKKNTILVYEIASKEVYEWLVRDRVSKTHGNSAAEPMISIN